MKVTIIVDNHIPPSAKSPFQAEHGLSMLIEVEKELFLFDTGQSDLVVRNLSLVGVHPSQLSAVILSHGHYDHTGGLEAVLSHARRGLPVYAHPGIFSERFSVSGKTTRFIGIPHRRPLLEYLGALFIPLKEPLEPAKDLWISGPIPRLTAYEKVDGKLVCQAACQEGPQDSVPDDMSMYYLGAKGVFVLAGCAHSGIVNVINRGRDVTKAEKVYGMIGGTHLGPASLEQKTATLEALKRYDMELIAANHCTGFPMMSQLHHIFDQRFLPAFVGTTVEYL